MRTGKTTYSVNGKKYFSINYLLFIYDMEVLEHGKTVKEVLKKYNIKENSKEAYWLYDIDEAIKKLIVYKKTLNVFLNLKNAVTSMNVATSILKSLHNYDIQLHNLFEKINIETLEEDLKHITQNLYKELSPIKHKFELVTQEWADLIGAFFGTMENSLYYNLTGDEIYANQFDECKSQFDSAQEQITYKINKLRDEAKAYNDYAIAVMLKVL